jgi:hypothetical protein
MKRLLFNLLAGLSLLLFLATVGLWVRSYRVADFFLSQSGIHQVVLSRGGIQWEEGILSSPSGRISKYRYATESPAASNYGHFSWSSDQTPPGTITTTTSHQNDGSTITMALDASMFNSRALTVPYWPLAVMSAVLPILAMLLRRRRYPIGLCRRCGYDLRATPEQCPECGTVPNQSKQR